MEISAECERKAGLWEVRVPELGDLIISSKRLDVATEQIKDLVHENQGVERCDVIVKIETSLPGIVCDLEAAQEKMLESRRLQEQASREIRISGQQLLKGGVLPGLLLLSRKPLLFKALEGLGTDLVNRMVHVHHVFEGDE